VVNGYEKTTAEVVATKVTTKYKRARVAVWGAVMLWCLSPIIWSLVCLVISLFSSVSHAVDGRIKQSQKAPAVVYVDPDVVSSPAAKSASGKPQSDPESEKHDPFGMILLMGGLGYAVLALLFGYGVWCCVGVICGQGCDRAFVRLEEWRS
jgi:hypothetical protein